VWQGLGGNKAALPVFSTYSCYDKYRLGSDVLALRRQSAIRPLLWDRLASI
jgi:hypothetical protein